MALNKTITKAIKDGEVKEDNFASSSVSLDKVGPNSVNSGKIVDASVAVADLSPSLDLSPKTVTLASSAVNFDNENFNISLLGFKMAVNESLTVFNLVDGVVDEFHDESGTDEAEGSNDNYCASNDLYKNQGSPITNSAGFSTSAITEPDTSTTASGNFSTGVAGTFTVPAGISNISVKLWGAGGSAVDQCEAALGGGGGGFTSGCLAVTPGQAIKVIVGEGGMQPAGHGCSPGPSYKDRKAAFFGGGGGEGMDQGGGYGGGLSGLVSQMTGFTHEGTVGAPDAIPAPAQAPYVYFVAGAGGGGGGHIPGNPGDFSDPSPTGDGARFGGAGGGLIGLTAGVQQAQTDAVINTEGPEYSPLPNTSGWPSCRGHYMGGGGSQTAGGQSGGGEPAPQYGGGFSGAFFEGGGVYGNNQPNKCHPLATGPGDHNMGSGGGGYYGGGAGGYSPQPQSGNRSGGGGSSYIGHPQVTSGATEAGLKDESGGAADPQYQSNTGEGHASLPVPKGSPETNQGEDGYVLITGCGQPTTSTTIVSTAFAANSVPTSSRIVVFEEDIATPTLNTDIIASISRDGGSNFTTATLTDSGYVTGSSGQRILTGQATISGQPSGQSMRWKLALANNAVKIHGVSLSWA